MLQTSDKKAYCNAKAVMFHLNRYLPPNLYTLSATELDTIVLSAYNSLITEVTSAESDRKRDANTSKKRKYSSMQYTAFYTLLSENGIIKKHKKQ